MSEKILAICQPCAEHNGGRWKGRATATLFLGPCDCCKKVKPLTHTQYWRDIRPEDKLEPAPEADATPPIEIVNASAPKAPTSKGRSILGKKNNE